MRNAEFMKLLTAMSELDHHQRKVLNTALNRQSNGLRVIELIETSFDTKSACPHCTNVELYRHGWVSGLNVIIVGTAKTFNALTGTPLAHLREKLKMAKLPRHNGAITNSAAIRSQYLHTS